MKISELIEKLKDMPQDAEVYVYNQISYYGESGYEPISELGIVTRTVHKNKRELELDKTFLAIN